MQISLVAANIVVESNNIDYDLCRLVCHIDFNDWKASNQIMLLQVGCRIDVIQCALFEGHFLLQEFEEAVVKHSLIPGGNPTVLSRVQRLELFRS